MTSSLRPCLLACLLIYSPAYSQTPTAAPAAPDAPAQQAIPYPLPPAQPAAVSQPQQAPDQAVAQVPPPPTNPVQVPPHGPRGNRVQDHPHRIKRQTEQPGHDTPGHYILYDMSLGTSTGETVRGPVRIWATELNTIRYAYHFNSAAKYTQAPDVWANLTTAAANLPSPTPPVAQPAAPAAPVPTPRAPAPAASARYAVPPADPYARLQALQQTIDKTTTDSVQLTANLENKRSTFDGPIGSLALIVAALTTYQNTAAASLAQVTQAGAALQTYLKSTSDNTDLLVNATYHQLHDPASIFMAGTIAPWPDPLTIVDLQNRLALNAKYLTDDLADFNTYSARSLPAMKAAETSLTALQTQYAAAETAYRTATQAKPDTSHDTDISNTKAELAARIKLLQADEQYLTDEPALLTAAVSKNQVATTNIAPLAPTSTSYQSFTTAQAVLLQWKSTMQTKLDEYSDYNRDSGEPRTHADPFAMHWDSTCAFAFAGTKDSVVTLTRVDLTPGQNASPETTLTITVECTSPLSISAGVVFSTVRDNVYQLAPNTTTANGVATTTNTITQTGNSPFHPLPLALVNVRMYEHNEHVALYASFGVAANIRGQNAGGSTAEYLVGPSIGFFRGVFLTAGAHFGNEVAVGSGYSVGSTLPTTQTTVPLSTNYHPGFGLGITFTKP